jgi:hypothetical protein
MVLDVYDPAWAAAWDSSKVSPFTDPNLGYFIGVTLGDVDHMLGPRPGPDLPAPRLHPHIAGAVLIAAPTQRAVTAATTRVKIPPGTCHWSSVEKVLA